MRADLSKISLRVVVGSGKISPVVCMVGALEEDFVMDKLLEGSRGQPPLSRKDVQDIRLIFPKEI